MFLPIGDYEYDVICDALEHTIDHLNAHAIDNPQGGMLCGRCEYVLKYIKDFWNADLDEQELSERNQNNENHQTRRP